MIQDRWRYGDAGDLWPVAFGDVWRAGPHVLACGDLEQGHAAALLASFGPAAVAYGDLPYTPALATGFRTKAGMSRPVDFPALLARAVEAVRLAGGGFLEIGKDWWGVLAGAVVASSGRVVGSWPITYYRRNPAALLQLSWTGASPAGDPSGMDDQNTPAWAVERCSEVGGLVFDPCAGRGLTVRAAHALGRRALALELNPRRLACALDWLAARGLEPKKEGSL